MCRHEDTIVTSSRARGFIGYSGKPMFRESPYEYLIRRRRKCLSCGFAFSTVEMKVEDADRLYECSMPYKRAVKEVFNHMQTYIQSITENFKEV